MDVVVDICRVATAVACLGWLIGLLRGRESFRDERGRLGPGWAALLAVTALVVLGWAATIALGETVN